MKFNYYLSVKETVDTVLATATSDLAEHIYREDRIDFLKIRGDLYTSALDYEHANQAPYQTMLERVAQNPELLWLASEWAAFEEYEPLGTCDTATDAVYEMDLTIRHYLIVRLVDMYVDDLERKVIDTIYSCLKQGGQHGTD